MKQLVFIITLLFSFNSLAETKIYWLAVTIYHSDYDNWDQNDGYMMQPDINNFNTYRECESYLYNTWGKDEGAKNWRNMDWIWVYPSEDDKSMGRDAVQDMKETLHIDSGAGYPTKFIRKCISVRIYDE